jgi:integrase
MPPAVEGRLLKIGPRLEALLRQLPSTGPLFPKMTRLSDKDRAAEFARRCRLLKIQGVSLHSYRRSWAQRAKELGYPERFAQSALGHNSKAVHEAYASDAMVLCPPLDDFEHKVIPMPVPHTTPERPVAAGS